MADITREIEITAALSSDYRAAFNAASSIAKSTASELAALTKREADLAKMTEIAGKSAQASAAGDAKAVESLDAAYNKLAAKLGLADRSAAGLEAELKRIGAKKKELDALNASASRSAEIGRLARQIRDYTQAAQKVKDPALLAALDRAKKRFRELGGVIPSRAKPAGFFRTLSDGLTSTSGPLGGLVRSLSVVRDAFQTTGGKFALAAGGIAAVGAAAVSAGKALWSLGTDTIRAGDAIAKTSRQLGVASDAYQELAYAAGLGGASESEFSNAVQHLNRQMEAATGGNGKATKAFKALGISVAEVKTMNAEEMFMRISDALSQVDDVAARTKTTMALFGGAGTKVATAISGGSDALMALRKEAKAAGYVMDGKTLKKAEDANDDLTRAQLQLRGVMRQVGVEVMPAVNDALREFTRLIRENRDDIAEMARNLGTGFLYGVRAVIGAVNGIGVAVQSVIKGIEFWRETFAAFHKWLSDRLHAIGDFISGIPGAVVSALKSVASSVAEWLCSLKDRVSAWISGVVDSLVAAVMEKIHWLASKLQKVPLIGKLFGDSGASLAQNGDVYVTINNSVDARGAEPGAGAAVKRAVEEGMSVSRTGEVYRYAGDRTFRVGGVSSGGAE